MPHVLAYLPEAACPLAPNPKSYTCPLAPNPKSYTLLATPGPSAEHEHTLPSPSPHLMSQLTWVLSPGESTTTVSPFVPGGVSDGQWHTVQLKYYNKVSCGRGSRSWKVLSLAQVLTQTWMALPPGGSVMALLSEREGSGGPLPPCWSISIPLGSPLSLGQPDLNGH